mmetsp:Transcript_2922/g.4439  ORF Transcript_2922/g.4439 Transcript_2922/m.4439 type:complete len:1085 (-) Transcript_2922:650-3904(-)
MATQVAPKVDFSSWGKDIRAPVVEQWKNEAIPIYTKLFGKDDLERYSKQQFPAPVRDLASNPKKYRKALNAKIRNEVLKFGLLALITKKRPTHERGCMASGVARVLKNDRIPQNSFFVPDRTFPIRIRHANLSLSDDAGSDIRGMSIKWSDTHFESPFDLLLNTGEISAFWNLTSFNDFASAKIANTEEAAKEWLRKYPAGLEGSISGLRREPNSFADLIYYAQLVFKFTADDGKERYCKFRVVPYEFPKTKESGLLAKADQEAVWRTERKVSCQKKDDYLREEYKDRVTNESVLYRLQIQIHEWRSEFDTDEVFNSGKRWDLSTHPWLDLANISTNQMMDNEDSRRTRFNCAQLPDGVLSFKEATHPDDYNSLAETRRRVYVWSQKMRLGGMSTVPMKSPKNILGPKSQYTLTIKTGDLPRAGTDARVYIALIGTLGRTREQLLDKTMHDDFERNRTDVYDMTMPDVGEPLMVYVRRGHSMVSPDWYLASINVKVNNKSVDFPTYRWINSKGITIRSGTATLPANDTNILLQQQRAIELSDSRCVWKWEGDGSLPNHSTIKKHEKLPLEEQFSDPKNKNFLQGAVEGGMNLALNFAKLMGEMWDSFDDFKKLFTTVELPAWVARWKEDEEFGRQMLQGANPVGLVKCSKIPNKFAVSNETVKGLLRKGTSLEQECASGRVFIIDHEILDPIARWNHKTMGCTGATSTDKRYVTAAMCLLYVNANERLVPIAIQLGQRPGPENPVFTPADSDTDWTGAKIWFKCADAQVHQMVTHLLGTHLLVEPFAIATWRNLPSAHPIYKLLRPHLRYTVAINTIGRDSLIAPGGVGDRVLAIGGGGHIDIMKSAFKTFDFWKTMHLPSALTQRGVENTSVLRNYTYRDDGLLVWRALFNYVHDIVSLYYEEDADVINDSEIQSWINDMQQNGYHGKQGQGHGLPTRFDTKHEMCEVITTLLWTASCQHAAVNFSQFDYYSFGVMAPGMMRQSPPTVKGKMTERELVDSLPSCANVSYAMAVAWNLSRFSSEEVFLGDYPENLFTDAPALKVQEQFRLALSQLTDTFAKRNEKIAVKYPYLMPTRIPNSIAI